MAFNEDEMKSLIRVISENLEYTKDSFLNTSLNSFNFGFVVDQSKNKTERDTYLAYGSVKVMVPAWNAMGTPFTWARPLRIGHGTLEIPKIGSTVILFGMGDTSSMSAVMYYINAAPIDENAIGNYTDFQGYFNTEDLGFTRNPASTYKGYIGGRLVKKVLENPSEARLIASTKKFAIYESDKDKELQIRADDNFNIKIHTGDEGKIQIGYLHPINDTLQTGNADIEIDAGVAGDVDIDTIDGDIDVKTTTGIIKLQSGNNSITISNSGIHIIGDTFISGTLMVSQEIHWKTVGFSPTGTPPYATATANRGSTHMHPTAVPGPPSPPTPGT